MTSSFRLCLAIGFAIAASTGVAGCARDEPNSAVLQQSGNSRSSDSSGSDVRDSSGWSNVASPSVMSEFEGRWVGESFAAMKTDGETSGAELRERLKQRSRLPVEERKREETWFSFELSIQPTATGIGDLTPYDVRLETVRHVPDQGSQTISEQLEFQIIDTSILRLRHRPTPDRIYEIELVKTPDQSVQLNLTSDNQDYLQVTLASDSD